MKLHRFGDYSVIPWGDLEPGGYGSLWDVSVEVAGLDAGAYAVRRLDGDGMATDAWEVPAALGAAIKASREGWKPGPH